jgi:GDPmannose 4,6-dehydratase
LKICNNRIYARKCEIKNVDVFEKNDFLNDNHIQGEDQSKIKLGLSDKLVLGNLDSYRDWGHAKDYVQAMWLMLQQEKPDSYVIATGETRSVREMVDCVFNYAGLDTKKYLFTDDKYCRPEELHYLRGDSSKAQRKLKWQPKISFNEMMEEMVDYWSARLSNKTVDLVEI